MYREERHKNKRCHEDKRRAGEHWEAKSREDERHKKRHNKEQMYAVESAKKRRIRPRELEDTSSS